MPTLRKRDYVISFAVLLLALALVIPFAAKASNSTPVAVENLPEIMMMQDVDSPVLEIKQQA